MLKAYQRETKLFELSRDMNKEELSYLKIRKNDVILECFHCNSFVTMPLLKGIRCNGFPFSRSAMFTNKATIFLDD